MRDLADAVRSGRRVEREIRGTTLRGSQTRIPRRRTDLVEENIAGLPAHCLADREASGG